MRQSFFQFGWFGAVCTLLFACRVAAQSFDTPRKIDGYRPIWFDLGQRSEYGSKYSGGLGTYTAKHHPLAVYAAKAKKTFFVYGGTTSEKERRLLAMISYFDHERGVVPKPTVVHDKQGVNDPHDNPSLNIDDDGHLWVFVSGRGRSRPGFKYRSKRPYDIDAFELILEGEFTYPQPRWIAKKGFLLLFTKYTRGRELYWSASRDGRAWDDHQKLAGMGGHYQMSNDRNGRVITAFNMHPGGKPDNRTNLYFAQTRDLGKTWETIDGKPLKTPLVDPACAALVHDYRREGRLVYLKDIQFDAGGTPILLFITSDDHRPGPHKRQRRWSVAVWSGKTWRFHEVTGATHNYDMGSLYVEPDGVWRIIAPTEPGPQLHGTGGEVAVWTSPNQGRTWRKVRQLTKDSQRNHAYVRRPVAAHSQFYAFWADGNPDRLSISRLYFTDKAATRVWQLPYTMTGDFAKPE